MATRLRWTTHANFAQGIVQDVPRHMLPENAVWDADNAIIKRSGTIARRGGLKTMQSASLQFQPYSIFHYRSRNVDSTSIVYVFGENNGATQGYATFAPGASATTVTIDSFVGITPLGYAPFDAFRHNEHVFFLGNYPDGTVDANYAVAGAPAGAFRAQPTGTPTVTAGSSSITGFTAMGGLVVGDILSCTAVGNLYTGRVVSIDAPGLKVVVSPTPTASFVAATCGLSPVSSAIWGAGSIGSIRTARHGCSFQNRIVLGNVLVPATGSTNVRYPYRVAWTCLPTESTVVTGTTYDGMHKLYRSLIAYPYNYVDLPQLASVEKVVPIGQGSLLILGSQGVAMLSGTLQSFTTTTGTISFSVADISTSVGCIASQTAQRTPAGVVFASREGVFMFDGSRLINTMESRISRLWRDTYATATMYGSATIGTHYLISTSAGNLLLNLQTGAWTKAGTFALAAAAVDLDDSNRVYGIRYGASAASSNTDIIYRADTILDPATGIEQDYGTTSFQMSVKTKTYTEGDPHNLNRFRHTGVVATIKGSGATMTVASTPGLEGEESGSTLGTLTASATGPQADRYDHQILSRALGYTFATTGNASEAEVVEVRTSSQGLRVGRRT